MKCEACGKDGTLDIRATLIRCSFCDAEWGRVNGFWVESKPPRCMECGGDGRTVEAEPQTCPSCAGTGREGGVKGGIEPSSPLPPADIPPSPHGSVRGTDAVCMPPVSAGGMTCPDCDGRGYGVTNVNKCGFCGGTGHVLRDHK
jgi:DnaJ-class molecular chaperone